MAGEVETADPPEVFAPSGFAVATAAEIHAGGWARRIAIEYPDSDADRLEDFDGFRRAAGPIGFAPPAG